MSNPFRQVYIEQLKGGQHKLDADKDGKIEGEDLAKLRASKKVKKEAAEIPFSGPYTKTPAVVTDKSGAKHSPMSRVRHLARAAAATAAKKAEKTVKEDIDEGTVPDNMKGKQKPYVSSDGKGNYEVLGNTGQTKATFSRKEHGMDSQKKAQEHLKKNYDSYMKEEAEQVEEGYYEKPASAYRRKGDEVGGGSSKNSAPFDGPYTKSKPVKNSDGTIQSPISRARELAKQALAKNKMKEEVELEEGDLTVRTLYNKFANAHVNGNDTKSTEKVVRKVHGDVVMGHMKKAANANAKGNMDGEERHFDNAQTAAKKTDRIGGTVGRGRSEFMRKRREWSEEVQIEEVEINEANHREFASKGLMHPDMAKNMNVGQEHDYYEHGTGDKVSG